MPSRDSIQLPTLNGLLALAGMGNDSGWVLSFFLSRITCLRPESVEHVLRLSVPQAECTVKAVGADVALAVLV